VTALPGETTDETAADEPEELEGGFSRRALRWIVGSVAVSLVASVLLMAYGRDLQGGPLPGANSFSDSALGHRAVVLLLTRLGLGVTSRKSLSSGDAGPGRPLVLAEPNPKGESWRPEQLDALRQEAASRKATLVLVLPKWLAGAPRKGKPRWLDSVRLMPQKDVAKTIEALNEADLDGLVPQRFDDVRLCQARWSRHSVVEYRMDVDALQLLKPGPNLTTLVSCGDYALVAERKATGSSPRIVLVADPDLLNNHGLGRGDNAILIYQLFSQGLGATGAVFDETIHGFNRDLGLIAEALSFPLVLGVLQGVILLGIVLWAGMGRFGKPLPASLGLAAGKEVLIDNTAKMLANSGHAGDSLARYFQQTVRAVAGHHFLPPDLTDKDRIERLQGITAARGWKLQLAELERAVSQFPPGRAGEDQATKIVRRLHDWRVEMMKNVD
jgi:hypothetical protein